MYVMIVDKAAAAAAHLELQFALLFLGVCGFALALREIISSLIFGLSSITIVVSRRVGASSLKQTIETSPPTS